MAFKIYTKTGDKGETSLFGGKRLLKNHIRIEAYGTVDELNAFIGLLRDGLHKDHGQLGLLTGIQKRLFTIGSNLASDPDKEMITPDIFPADIELLEKAMDDMDAQVPALKHFLLPGGHTLISYCHLCRTICRRAERRIIELGQKADVELIIVRYVNRLSDYFFLLGRLIAHELQAEEIKWEPRKSS